MIGRVRAGCARLAGVCSLFSLPQVGCTATSDPGSSPSIAVGAVLPFTGKEDAIGRNLEQALLLAEEDVNRAGGVNGTPLRIISRDSNSGSPRGLESLLGLLYNDQVPVLIGPEENELANDILPDVKGLDILNILPGYTAPAIERISSSGAWLRLAPSPSDIGCAMAKAEIAGGTSSANAIVALDDYNQSLAAEFNAQFGTLGGVSLPSVTVSAGAPSYVSAIQQVLGYAAERTLLIAYPATAAQIVTEWQVAGRGGDWDLAPMLDTEVFLLNTPLGALSGYTGLSPSLNLREECTAADPSDPNRLSCTRANANAFAKHFRERWDDEDPFPAAYFYYDAVILLAMGLEYGWAETGSVPKAARLQSLIRQLGSAQTDSASWRDLPQALATLAGGVPVQYVGAAAAYQFDQYGAAAHDVFDTWSIEQQAFVDTGSIVASCPRNR